MRPSDASETMKVPSFAGGPTLGSMVILRRKERAGDATVE